jgi:anti-sigma factor RsiW
MSKCQSIDPFVTPFVDGELGEAERHLVEAHLRACPPCHSRVAAERAVHDLVRDRRDGLHAACAPAALRTRCTGLARASAIDNLQPVRNPQSATRPSAWRSQIAPFALAASLVLGVGGAFLYQATDKSARVMAAELTADHMKCFALDGVLGTHDTAASVESSMMSSFGWRMQLPSDASRAGLELVGSRPCLYGEGKIAHIMYRHEGKPVSLFMLPRSARTSELVEVLGHEAAIWCAGNRTFVLIAREPKRDVERLASYVQASLH